MPKGRCGAHYYNVTVKGEYVHCCLCGNDNNQGSGFKLHRLMNEAGDEVVLQFYQCKICGHVFTQREPIDIEQLKGRG